MWSLPHLALANSSEIRAYVQTDAARKAAKLDGDSEFDVRVPGTLKLTGRLGGAEGRDPRRLHARKLRDTAHQ